MLVVGGYGSAVIKQKTKSRAACETHAARLGKNSYSFIIPANKTKKRTKK